VAVNLNATDQKDKARLTKEKKSRILKATMRDKTHSCYTGMRVIINGVKYIIIITLHSGLYLLDCEKKTKYMKWKEWNSTKKLPCDESFCIWDDEVKFKIKNIIKKINLKPKRTPVVKIKRTPAIKRTPIKKEK
jgi:hypothetical protein